MTKISALNNEDLFKKSDELLKEIPFSKISIKLKGISALKENEITKVAQIFSVSRNTLKSWVKNFNSNGIEGLKPKERKARTPKLNSNLKDVIRLWIKQDPNLTLKEMVIRIKKNFNITISQSGLWYNLKKMNLSYITARPKHYKQNKVKSDEFKKNSCQK